MQVAADEVVSIHFSLSDADGELIVGSADQKAPTYIHGLGNLIPGLETHNPDGPRRASVNLHKS